MVRVNTIAVIFGVLASQAAPKSPQFDPSGDWKLASATTNMTRDGKSGDQPTRTFVSDASAFNCGRECRITYKGSTLTVENARLEAGTEAAGPTVAIVVDGRSHTVIDSVNLGNTIETLGQWEDGKLAITSMLLGRPIPQTISLEQNQLVVVKVNVVSGAKLTLRYAKK